MIYDVVHRTQYDYDAPVASSFAEVRQLPDDVDGQVCLRREVVIEPAPDHQREHRDYFGNLAATVTVHDPHTKLVVMSTSRIDTTARPTSFGPVGDRPWTSFTAAQADPSDLDAIEFSLDSPLVARSSELADYAMPSFGSDVSLSDGVLGLCSRIHADFEFDAKATEVDTPIAEVMRIRKGVCQDFTHVMIGALRSIGLPASYVSGYLETEPPPGQPRLAGVDRSHAWVGVSLGAGSWIGVDPTNNQIAGPRYVTTARGRDYKDVPPLRGVIFTDAKTSTLTVSVDVAPL
jgi:transglutaminase-like putative cysteine protease